MISVYRTQSLNIKNIESRARFGAMVGDCCGPCTVGGTGGMHQGPPLTSKDHVVEEKLKFDDHRSSPLGDKKIVRSVSTSKLRAQVFGLVSGLTHAVNRFMPLLEETECVIQLLALLEKTCKPVNGNTGDLWDVITVCRAIPNGLRKYLPWDDTQTPLKTRSRLVPRLYTLLGGRPRQDHSLLEVDCVDKNSEALELDYNLKLPLKLHNQSTMGQKKAGGTRLPDSDWIKQKGKKLSKERKKNIVETEAVSTGWNCRRWLYSDWEERVLGWLFGGKASASEGGSGRYSTFGEVLTGHQLALITEKFPKDAS
ncbi:hypothetical protein J6590_028302 [Homalodisca vitripennis]|nr:hypothetical protein J6590_028302 [Homalodisca vitripennis]